MSLGARLIILILLAAVPVFLLQITTDYEIRRSSIAAVVHNAETLAGLVAARQDRIVEGARLLLEATSHLQSIREKNAERCSARLREMAGKVQELTAMAVLTPEGERWCVSLSGTGPINLADREYFQETMRTRSMQSSDFIIGRQTGEGSLVFTYPVVTGDGPVESVLFVAYRTSVMSRMLNDPPLPPGVIVSLLDRSGVVTARSPDAEQWMGKDLSKSPVVQRAVRERRGSLQDTADWAGPGQYAFAFAPMQLPSKLTVLVALPLTAALHEADSLFWREAGWTTLIFALAALLAILGAHLTVIRPLRELRVAVDNLARGQFGGIPGMRASGAKEISSLAAHFESMARSLQQRQSQLVEAVRQKEILLKEVNHRVKNSLQLVASLLGLQRGHMRDAEARRQFDEAARRINTVAQIHQRLYQDENVDRVSLDEFLRDMCGELGALLGEKGVTVTCDASPCYLPTQEVIPLALIVNELITNAFKYSYPDGGGGRIRVACHPQGKEIVLSVADDGISLPDNFDPGQNSGLGMKMISALARQLRATLSVERRTHGKSFVLRVPNPETAK